jgi:hypothetical protein
MSDELPYEMVYVRDELAMFAPHDARERGALRSLHAAIWDSADGQIKFDPRRLARIAGLRDTEWDETWSGIEHHFDVNETVLRMPVVTAGLRKAREQKEARQRGARATNARRGRGSLSDTPSGSLSDTPSGSLSDTPSGSLSDTPSGSLSDTPSGSPPSPSPSPSPSGSPSGSPAPAPGGGGAAAALGAFRQARDLAAQSKRTITVAEPQRDIAEFKAVVERLDPDMIQSIRDAAQEYFQRDGRGDDDQRWRRERWSLHFFSTQGLETLLPDIARRRSTPRSASAAPVPVVKTYVPPTDEQLEEIRRLRRGEEAA